MIKENSKHNIYLAQLSSIRPYNKFMSFPELHTFYYFQSLCQFVRKHPVRILLPSVNQHDREVFEPQMDPLTWLPAWQQA